MHLPARPTYRRQVRERRAARDHMVRRSRPPLREPRAPRAGAPARCARTVRPSAPPQEPADFPGIKLQVAETGRELRVPDRIRRRPRARHLLFR